jgi:hypothetical protein
VAELTDADWEQLTRDLSRRVAASAPDWTEPTGSDPGITLLELFAFLSESLVYRSDQISDEAWRVRAIASRLERIAASRCADATLTRPRYLTGKLMTAADFEEEQEYVRTKHRRHNRLLHGVGVVSGLDVTMGSDDGGQLIVVSPGLAIGPTGEELLLCDVVRLPLHLDPGMYVAIGLVERAIDGDATGEPTRIAETASVAIVDEVLGDHLVISRLRRGSDGDEIDPAFEPLRVAR